EIKLFQGSLKFKRRLVEVIIRHRRTGVHAHIKGLGCGEDGRHGALHLSLLSLFAVNPEPGFARGFVLDIERNPLTLMSEGS
ncbi:MAG: hypothetical protein P8Z37_18855, partial [Acidobacteriota bacterium]